VVHARPSARRSGASVDRLRGPWSGDAGTARIAAVIDPGRREAMMKITSSGPPAGPGQRRRIAGRGDTSHGAFAEQVGAKPSASPGLASAVPLTALGGVLAVQEVPDPIAERRRAMRHGHSVLDELQALQIGLVEGWVQEGALRRLAGLLDRLRPATADPELAAVLDEIELRAGVELAKLARGPR
jgi:hypothetical protein